MPEANSRRQFLETMTIAAGAAMAVRPALAANDRVRIGVIGYGARGSQITADAMACANTQVVAVADIYTVQLEKAKQRIPGVKTYFDHKLMLEDRSIDAVLIATPQHLHCEHFVASIQAGKHVYQEKTMAFNVADAKKMRAAYLPVKGKQTVQVGHQSCSFGQVADALEFLKGNKLGKITALDAMMYRNTAHGKPQWSRPVTPEMTSEHILWNQFLGPAAKVPFDPNRYINWRFFWDYSGGNVYENMCHQVAFWYKVAHLKIPKAVTMTGGLYLWKDGRQVPDTMNVSMEQPEEILFSWLSGFGNSDPGMTEQLLGDNGSIFKSIDSIRYMPEKVNLPSAQPLEGHTPTPPHAHMQNFLDCVRSGKETNCPFDLGFNVSIACRMAVESYRQKRTMRWDPAKEEIV
ncbi:MAG TPA: Gfo/Idh/MocA family oxidoreductase [Bryobacteraceae bacterium]